MAHATLSPTACSRADRETKEEAVSPPSSAPLVSPRLPARSAPAPVRIDLYRWAGRFGPLQVKTPCGECLLTEDIVADVLQKELRDVPTELGVHDWLSVWWRPLLRGGWHAPIVTVDGRVVSQGVALNRGVLTQAVVEAYSRRAPLEGTQLFGKETCPHCLRAKRALEVAGIPYRYRNVVEDPRALFEMLTRVKPLYGLATPITVPQIWVQGTYLGGADQLEAALAEGRLG